jgi:hypothetical protein
MSPLEMLTPHHTAVALGYFSSSFSLRQLAHVLSLLFGRAALPCAVSPLYLVTGLGVGQNKKCAWLSISQSFWSRGAHAREPTFVRGRQEFRVVRTCAPLHIDLFFLVRACAVTC